jgi:hypothetical protein
VGDNTKGEDAAKPTEAAVLAAYAALAARRAQWDSLVWQVPTLSLTAQAFLLTIALSQGNDAWARIISAVLSLNITVISIMLMARHRQAEIHDAHWLERVERDILRLGTLVTHGPEFRRSREQLKDISAGPIGRAIPLVRMFPVWVGGLSLFGLCDFVVIIRALVTL